MGIDFSQVVTSEDKAYAAAEAERSAFKVERAAQVRRISVTTEAGRCFDGDEISQGRMARAILALDATGPGATVRWVLHDNTAVDVGAPELREALALAGQAQADLWVQPQG
ncbi:hypothetical protein K8U54_19275 [Pseudomonas fulva]|uniref:DUF4376 domain-containing protein n=1 Tax=Pseudomonas fulva TaxID=47880 RepID=UPI00201E0BF9|nr:hypothetical protein [Pseudomonas fulva]UQY33833.1 hypothetical protein K8U54_19275 [Pseudomonas fulva]